MEQHHQGRDNEVQPWASRQGSSCTSGGRGQRRDRGRRMRDRDEREETERTVLCPHPPKRTRRQDLHEEYHPSR
jgi:hypothetical protein